MKRKFAHRPNWRRVLKRRMAVRKLEYQDFKGYAVLIVIDKITEALWVDVCGKSVCVADKDYSWLTLFPEGESYVVTAMLDDKQKIAQWYIDICKEHGLTETGIPWYDDLYLDIIVSQQGDISLIDQEDLEQALRKGIIDQAEYDYAFLQANRLLELIKNGQFKLIHHTRAIYEILTKELLPAEVREGAQQ